MATFSPEEVEQWIQHTDCSMQPFTTMILNGVTAVNELHKWEWLKNYQPKDGFMWSHSADVDQLTNKISELDSTHSGASMAALVRTLQHMAQDLLPPDPLLHLFRRRKFKSVLYIRLWSFLS
jgi:hypothetical protein